MENTPEREHHGLAPDLGAELRAARERAGLSLRQLAPRVGLLHGSLCLVEQGKRCPSLVVARDLVEVLELEPVLATRLLAAARPDVGHSRAPALLAAARDREAAAREARALEQRWTPPRPAA
jgi:DNA-binding XRE family transcriptional regulator